MDELRKALEAWQEWEAAMLRDGGMPVIGGGFQVIGLHYDRYVELQLMREDALATPASSPPIGSDLDGCVLADVERCLNFFASVIKSGEGWSSTCEAEFRKAKFALAAAPPVPSDWKTGTFADRSDTFVAPSSAVDEGVHPSDIGGSHDRS